MSKSRKLTLDELNQQIAELEARIPQIIAEKNKINTLIESHNEGYDKKTPQERDAVSASTKPLENERTALITQITLEKAKLEDLKSQREVIQNPHSQKEKIAAQKAQDGPSRWQRFKDYFVSEEKGKLGIFKSEVDGKVVTNKTRVAKFAVIAGLVVIGVAAIIAGIVLSGGAAAAVPAAVGVSAVVAAGSTTGLISIVAGALAVAVGAGLTMDQANKARRENNPTSLQNNLARLAAINPATGDPYEMGKSSTSAIFQEYANGNNEMAIKAVKAKTVEPTLAVSAPVSTPSQQPAELKGKEEATENTIKPRLKT